MSSIETPSLFSQPKAPRAEAGRTARTLFDIMYDGFYLLFLLRRRAVLTDAAGLAERVRQFLAQVDQDAKRLDLASADIYDAKYAFCAAVDEAVLASKSPARDAWQRAPLQLALFGEQLAGTHFFDKLDALRQQGASRVAAIEVFHMCLLLGFEGRYMLDGPEKLQYEIARLGEDIAHLRGKRAVFAPHALAPDRIAHALRTQVPLWGVGAALALAALLAWLSLNAVLGNNTARMLSQYNEIVKRSPRAANLTITLP